MLIKSISDVLETFVDQEWIYRIYYMHSVSLYIFCSTTIRQQKQVSGDSFVQCQP